MSIIWPVIINGCARVCTCVYVCPCVCVRVLSHYFSTVVGLEYHLGDILCPRMYQKNGNGKISLLSDNTENIYHPIKYFVHHQMIGFTSCVLSSTRGTTESQIVISKSTGVFSITVYAGIGMLHFCNK